MSAAVTNPIAISFKSSLSVSLMLLGITVRAFAAQGVELHVNEGTVLGENLPDGSAVFRSIPYAAPPLDQLRWRPPQPVIAWHGVRDVRKDGKPCTQLDEGWNVKDTSIGSEDCLYLSIHEPKHKSDEQLPVLVWIHGGSNRAGSGYYIADSPIYKHGIVVVSIEYRLGVFGFLALPELAAESAHRSSGNYALLDQIAALKWVRTNISVFGGNPHNVTIAGQSAGAMDIGQLMRSPLAAGLFSKAIQESGVLAPPRSAADNEKIGRDLIETLGIPSGSAALTQLRKLPANALLAASMKLNPPSGDHNLLWMETSADGWVIPEGKNNLYKSGNISHVPHIIGNNTQEFILDGSPDAARAIVAQVYGSEADSALNLYSFTKTQSPADDLIFGNVGTQILTDWIFRCPSYQLAKWEMAKHQKVWRYEFGIARPGSLRVEHNAELDYVLNAVPAGATSQSWPPLQEYWANFVKFGDPNGRSLPRWPDIGASANYVEFLPTGIQYGKGLHANLCRLLAKRNATH